MSIQSIRGMHTVLNIQTKPITLAITHANVKEQNEHQIQTPSCDCNDIACSCRTDFVSLLVKQDLVNYIGIQYKGI